MSVIATAVKHMLAARMPHEEIVHAVAEMEASAAAPPTRTARQERNARYYENRRLKASEASEIKTSKTFKTISDAPLVCAQVVNTTSSSLRSEEGKPLTHPSGASPSKTTKATKSRFVPDGWQPGGALLADLAERGFVSGEIERELSKFRDHEFRDPHSDWPRAFRKWMTTSRQFATRPAHERPNPNAKLDAKNANYARAWEGSERAFGRSGEP